MSGRPPRAPHPHAGASYTAHRERVHFARRMRAARVSVPIALTAGIVAITIALTVGWQILVARESEALRRRLHARFTGC